MTCRYFAEIKPIKPDPSKQVCDIPVKIADLGNACWTVSANVHMLWSKNPIMQRGYQASQGMASDRSLAPHARLEAQVGEQLATRPQKN